MEPITFTGILVMLLLTILRLGVPLLVILLFGTLLQRADLSAV